MSVTPNFIPSDSLTHRPFLSSRLSLSLPLPLSFCLSLRLTAGLRLHFHTCLIGCSPWAAVESPPAASDRQRQSCLGQTCLLLLSPPPSVSVWTAASRRMGLVHEWVFKCVCMCAWIRPLQENYHFRFYSITASKHIQAFITHFIRLMFTDPDNVNPKGPSLERDWEKFTLSFWCKNNINSGSFLCSVSKRDQSYSNEHASVGISDALHGCSYVASQLCYTVTSPVLILTTYL